MLDKSIPYKNIIMRMPYDKVQSQPEPVLPDGFSFRFFQEGDEKHWARIETSVLEFADEASAERYFTRDYLPCLDDLKHRCVFVLNRDKLPVATATAWYASSSLGYRHHCTGSLSCLHTRASDWARQWCKKRCPSSLRPIRAKQSGCIHRHGVMSQSSCTTSWDSTC